jgi:hypothetical protein
MQTSALQRQVSDEFVAGSGDLQEVQEALLTAGCEHDADEQEASVRPGEPRPNPLWAVNGALVAFVFAALMYLASRV